MHADPNIAHAETVKQRASGSEDSEIASWLGERIGSRYRIVSHVASGGMGHVFLARHCELRVRAAVKLLRESSATLVREFTEEARLLAHQNHPNIVRVLDSGLVDEPTPYLVMEYVAGRELTEFFAVDRPLSHPRLLRMLRRLAAAIDHLHAQGIVHRDIKPANILVDESAGDAVKLIDFGIAVCEAEWNKCLPGLAGTPTYMAPEQVVGGPCSPAIDRYALGALALELLTGRPPFDAPSVPAILYGVLNERPQLPSARGLAIPGLDAVIERALAREPRARFSSAGEFVRTLTGVLSSPSRRRDPLTSARQG